MKLSDQRRRVSDNRFGTNFLNVGLYIITIMAGYCFFLLTYLSVLLFLFHNEHVDELATYWFNISRGVPAILLNTFLGFVAICALLREKSSKESFGITNEDIMEMLSIAHHLIFLLLLTLFAYTGSFFNNFFIYKEMYDLVLIDSLSLLFFCFSFLLLFSYDIIRIINAVFSYKTTVSIYRNFYKYFWYLHIRRKYTSKWETDSLGSAAELFVTRTRKNISVFTNIREIKFENNSTITKEKWKIYIKPIATFIFIMDVELMSLFPLFKNNNILFVVIVLILSISLSLFIFYKYPTFFLRLGGIEIGYRFIKTNGKYKFGSQAEVPFFNSKMTRSLRWIKSLLALFQKALDDSQYDNCAIFAEALIDFYNEDIKSHPERKNNDVFSSVFNSILIVIAYYSYVTYQLIDSGKPKELKEVYQIVRNHIKYEPSLFTISFAEALVFDTDRNRSISGERFHNDQLDIIMHKFRKLPQPNN